MISRILRGEKKANILTRWGGEEVEEEECDEEKTENGKHKTNRTKKDCKEKNAFGRKKTRLWYLEPLSGSFFA